jgi:FKBP-type peptidyl-prolyl cis-trans isomerase 2
MMKRLLPGIVPLLLVLGLAGCGKPTVANNKMVSMDYKGTLADGTVFSESPAGKPMEFLEGGGSIIPTVEKGMLGMKIGDRKTITVKAADAYGEINQAALKEVPRDQFPKDAKLEVGQQFQVSLSSGQVGVVKIAAVGAKTVTVDFNHPLAGKDLTFEVTVVKIRDATKEELAAAKQAAAPTAQ